MMIYKISLYIEWEANLNHCQQLLLPLTPGLPFLTPVQRPINTAQSPSLFLMIIARSPSCWDRVIGGFSTEELTCAAKRNLLNFHGFHEQKKRNLGTYAGTYYKTQ